MPTPQILNVSLSKQRISICKVGTTELILFGNGNHYLPSAKIIAEISDTPLALVINY